MGPPCSASVSPGSSAAPSTPNTPHMALSAGTTAHLLGWEGGLVATVPLQGYHLAGSAAL